MSIVGGVGNIVGGIGGLVNGISSLLGSSTDWKSQLKTASFRGVVFGVLTNESSFGRRIADHLYPYRDRPYTEDMGRAQRKYSVVGFIVQNDVILKTSDVLGQRDALIAAAETPGIGVFVHPTIGRINVVVPPGGLRLVDSWEKGGSIAVFFEFEEAGPIVYPAPAASTGSNVMTSAGVAAGAASSDFAGSATTALKNGSAVVQQGVTTTLGFVAKVSSYANKATALFNVASSLSGSFGRFFSANQIGNTSSLPQTQQSIAAQVDTLTAAGAVSRAGILAAGITTGAAANAGDPVGMAAQVQNLVALALDAIAAPADAVTITAQMATYFPGSFTPATAVGSAMALMENSTANMCRRMAVIALAQASATYQPTSYNDAANLRTIVCNLIDQEIEIAGNAGDDATFGAFGDLRVSVVQDLTTRGASLAPLVTIKIPQTTPAPALAQKLYQDGTRDDELIAESNPIHPAFLPTSFLAKSR